MDGRGVIEKRGICMKLAQSACAAAILLFLTGGASQAETGSGVSNTFTMDTRVPLAVDESPVLPEGFGLFQNYPNPFNPATTIRFSLPAGGFAALRIYDLTGRLIREIHAGRLGAGTHSYQWDGRGPSGIPASSGVYFYRLQFSGLSIVRTMQLLR